MRTIGVVQGGGDHYPFVDPSDDIKGVVADISVGLNKEVLSVSMQSLIIEDSVEICLVDENDTVLFNSADGSYDRKEDSEWGGYYRIVYWESRELQLKLVLYKTNRYLKIHPENGILDLRTVFVKPPHVYSITIVDRNGQRHYCNEKKIIFQEGYNTDLELEPSNTGVRRQSTLTIDVGAGYGAGRVPCTSEESVERVLRSINSVTTEDGSFNLIPEDGYCFESEPNIAGINIYNTDTPCCSCETMEDLSDYVADLAEKYWKISEEINGLRDRHKTNIDNWSKKSPSNPRITREPFMLQAVGDGCQNVMVRADFTNTTSANIAAGIDLSFNFFKTLRTATTLPDCKTDVIHYQENGELKTKYVSHWVMKTYTSDLTSDEDTISIYTTHLEPGKTISIQLTGIYTGYRYNNVSLLVVHGAASSNGVKIKSDTKMVDCSCAYNEYMLSDITNKDSLRTLYNKVWEIKQR